jgi:glycosyltransferase involved in cell wall biosynthesis
MKITIVMPSFNQARFVEAALKSIFSQSYKNWEILFVDGGSTDGTMEIVDRYRSHLAYCVSERDKGQSDALRKGFDRATGDVFTWLNTDDLLLPGALAEVAETFGSRHSLNWILGNVIWIDAEDTILKCWRGESDTPGLSRIGLLTAGGPSAFFRPELYRRVGGMNVDLHYQMDTELWWRFVMAGEHYHRLRRYTWALRLHEAAKVSGHMFSAPEDHKQRKIERRKQDESRHIAGVTSGYQISIPAPLRSLVSAARKAISPSYLRGRIDRLRFDGRNLSSMIAKARERV